jgi:Domain of unknown function (DUF4403)
MATVDSLPVLPPSYVSAPVSFDLRPVLADIEAELPRRIGSLEKRMKVPGKPLLVAVELERRPLRFTFGENSVAVEAVFGYRGKAWLDTPVKPSVSCGGEGPPPRVRIRVASEYSMDSTWRMRTRSRVVEMTPLTAQPRDRCEISLLSIDVTDEVVSGARSAIDQQLRAIDRRLSRVDFHSPISDLWRMLQQPLRITDSTVWLLIDPLAVALGPIVPRDSSVVADVALLARPRFVSGRRPPDGDAPLPPLGRAQPGPDTALVLVEGLLRYGPATEILRKELRGERVRVGWRWVTIGDLTAVPAGNGRVALGVDLKGTFVRGRVWFTGRPAFDSTTRMITMPDLELDVRSRDALLQGLAWVADGPLTGWIRSKAQIPADTLLAAARTVANKALVRDLADGVRLVGVVLEAKPIGVTASAEGLVARARGTAQLRLDIRQENLIPGRR